MRFDMKQYVPGTRQFLTVLIGITLVGSLHASRGLVVSPDSTASAIGMQILHENGNAVDAAVATMFALGVTQPWTAGMGAGGEMVIYLARQGKTAVISFRERAPIEANMERFYRNPDDFRFLSTTGFRSVCTPGMIAGAARALESYGTMDVKTVLAPVIQLARQGVVVSRRFNKLLVDYYDIVERYRATSDIFLPDWLPLAEGDSLKRDDLANAMETLSLRGFRDFYHGEMARDVINYFRIYDGFLTVRDLQQFHVSLSPGVHGSYRGYTVVSTAPPSSGGAALIAMLKTLENTSLTKHPFNSGLYVHIMLEALKQVLVDRRQYNGDPEFGAPACRPFISARHARELADHIDTARVYQPDVLTSGVESSSAAHISVSDAAGNAVSVTQSLGTYFGAAATHPGTGILFNNSLYHFSEDSTSINAVAPQKRAAISIAPTIVLQNGKPVLILGASGADRAISSLAHIIIAVLDYHMSIEAAVDAPRFHYENGFVQLETRMLSDVIEYLKGLGHQTRLRIDYDDYFGIVQAIHIGSDANIHGANDPRGK